MRITNCKAVRNNGANVEVSERQIVLRDEWGWRDVTEFEAIARDRGKKECKWCWKVGLFAIFENSISSNYYLRSENPCQVNCSGSQPLNSATMLDIANNTSLNDTFRSHILRCASLKYYIHRIQNYLLAPQFADSFVSAPVVGFSPWSWCCHEDSGGIYFFKDKTKNGGCEQTIVQKKMIQLSRMCLRARE